MRSTSYQIATRLFIRLIGIIYLLAFMSAMVQIKGLIGENGILPFKNIVTKVKSNPNLDFMDWPSLLYFFPSDQSLETVCFIGAITSAFIICGIAQKWMLLVNFCFYLSIVHAGQEFFAYQWDSLLLETGIVAFLLASNNFSDRFTLAIAPSRVGLWAARFLLFKLMFQSGIVKILSHDPSWASLTALKYHFMTQPLPNPLAWYAHHAPQNLLKLATAMTLVIELIFSWMILIPNRFGPWAAITFAPMTALQLIIMFTGNYGFFNLLTLCLCLMLVDDDLFHEWLPKKVFWRIYVHPYAGEFIERKSYLAPVYLICSTTLFLITTINQAKIPISNDFKTTANTIQNAVGRFRIANNYGLFSIMTRTRPEIVVETSHDGETWEEVNFKYKIGNTDQKPPMLFFHMPRLDWQLWFASLSTYEKSPWFGGLILRILEGSHEVRNLIGQDGSKPIPKYIRAYLYDYTFSPYRLKKSGIWWTRTPLRPYVGIAEKKP